MKIYCSNCGLLLKLTRKALPKYGTVLDLVDPHTCLEVPVDPASIIIDATPIGEIPKFVSSLNDLESSRNQGMARVHKENYGEGKSLRPSSMTGTNDLRDMRFDQQDKRPSTAPSSVLDQIKSMSNSIPSHEANDGPTDSEMGD